MASRGNVSWNALRDERSPGVHYLQMPMMGTPQDTGQQPQGFSVPAQPGRVPWNMSLKTFNTAASPFDPNYTKGENISWSQILKFPTVLPSKFDILGDKAVEVTINDQSIFLPGGGTPQLGFRRAGLLMGNGSDATNIGVKTFHWSVKQDLKAKMNLTHEYMNVWHEANSYDFNQFSFNTGIMLDQDKPTDTNVSTTGLDKRLWKFLDKDNDVLWTTAIDWEEWQNFAVTLDYDENDISGGGQFQIGILKKPTDTVSVVYDGYQESHIYEGQIYGGIFIEDSSGGCISRDFSSMTLHATAFPLFRVTQSFGFKSGDRKVDPSQEQKSHHFVIIFQGIITKGLFTYNVFTDERWKPGEMFQEGRTIQDFALIDQQPGRFEATLMFAELLRILFNHPDWSQIHSFCTKRYSRSNHFESRSSRKLHPPKATTPPSAKSITADFNTDISLIGFPPSFIQKLGAAASKAQVKIFGPDPLNCSLGPAISVGIGAGAYMDLLYGGNPPGVHVTPPNPSASSLKKGGRDRTLQDWASVWTCIAEWVYEMESTSIAQKWSSSYTYKYHLSEDEDRSFDHGGKWPRKYLQTDAIRAADAIRDVFEQLAADTLRFQGLEWDFLTLGADLEVEKAFGKRFGFKRDGNLALEEGNLCDYEGLDRCDLRPCPLGYGGREWEDWLLSVEGGNVVVVKTVFQALWAVMLLTQLPLTIRILEKGEKFPRFLNPNVVYL
ncbi:hypothetical protein B7494_g956 [Chlorociboria aeruginascens]|nr:hypothetical protein B7494_g956 [Chlorociboria aeruginascens]